MSQKLISICIPTYNRLEFMKFQLKNIYMQLKEINCEKVEVVVSVNPANDGTEEYLKYFATEENIVLNFNSYNIGGMKNIYAAIEKASGKYIWVVSDDDLLLPGAIKHVTDVLEKKKNIAWLHINAARLNDDPNKKNAKIINPQYYWGKGGYFENGKQTLIKKFKTLDGAVLFSTANVLLRSSAIRLREKCAEDNMCSLLTCIFESALHGSAYIMDDINILAGGGETTWKERAYDVNVHHFNDALFELVNWGYTECEVKGIVRYRMTHEGLFIWFEILLQVIKEPPKGIRDLKKYYSYLPITTIFCVLFSPILAGILFIRHHIRNLKRKRKINKLKQDNTIMKIIREHC